MKTLVALASLGAGVYLAIHSPDAAPPNEQAPRGIRNNNPGNIEQGAAWQGLALDQSSDDRFAVFKYPVWGIRALARTLNTYRSRDGLPGLGGPGVDTIREIIYRWAPPKGRDGKFENYTESYVRAVANEIQIADSVALQFGDYPALIKAIIRHENGVQPYPDSLIMEGIERARA